MATVRDVELLPLVWPRARPLRVIGRITHPLANESDSYLGGFASGARFTYNDAMQFVWWTPGLMPVPPVSALASFSNAFSSAFEGGYGSPQGAGFSSAFSGDFR